VSDLELQVGKATQFGDMGNLKSIEDRVTGLEKRVYDEHGYIPVSQR